MGSIARRSSGSWTVTVTARSGHSSGIFSRRPASARSMSWRGSSTAFRRELPEDKLTFNVGLIGGGATAELDRADPPRRDRQDQHHRRRPRSPAATCAR
jgi:glutamate carboxypeptidase